MLRFLSRPLVLLTFVLAGPAAWAADDCALRQVASIPATLSPHNALLLSATINDHPVKIEVDTGASLSTLSQKFAERAGMPIEDMRGFVYGLTGLPLDHKTRISTMHMGGLQSSNESFVLTPIGGDGSDDQPVGLLGSDYLQNYDVEIDVASGTVKLFDPKHCVDHVVYWAPDFLKMPIFYRGNTTLHRPMVQILVDGKPLLAAVDTGAYATVMRLATASSQFGLSTDSPDVKPLGRISGIEGKKLDTFEHTFQSLVFGGITLRNPRIVLAPIDTAAHVDAPGSHIKVGAADEPDVLIGMSLLKQLHLYLSYSEKALYFTLAAAKQSATP